MKEKNKAENRSSTQEKNRIKAGEWKNKKKRGRENNRMNN
jgi:hypothetical protein